MEVKRYSHVQHISSEVIGIISPKENAFSALAAVFPAGTLSGTPKIESMKIIERLEGNPRGPYGGAIGYFGFNGDCKMAIPIRSMFISNGKAIHRQRVEWFGIQRLKENIARYKTNLPECKRQ